MTCSIKSCGKRTKARSWCSTHYSRWAAHGDPLFTQFHYGYKTPEYGAWLAARARCRNARNPRYKHYGGRGITFSARWNDFEVFLADLGKRPKGTTLERIDNNGNYEPGNVRWATPSEQNHNRRPMSATGVKGVTVTGYANLGFRAQIKRKGKGAQKCFATLSEAANWYARMSEALYG